MTGEESAIRRRSCRLAGLAGLLLLLLALVPALARAHKVTVFAWVEGETVYTESKFSGGRPAQGARIEVYDAAGEKLLEGRTDEEGRFAFQPPRPEALRVVLTAGAGHRNEWRLAAEEFAGAAPLGTSPAPPPSPAAPGSQAPAADPHGTTVSLSKAELQSLIESSLDKKLAPILQRLGSLSDGPTLPDIVGGIGYIVGFVGLAAYLNARRKSG